MKQHKVTCQVVLLSFLIVTSSFIFYPCTAQKQNTFFKLTILFKQPVTDTVTLSYKDSKGMDFSEQAIVKNGKAVITGNTCHPYWMRYGSKNYKTNGGFLLSPGSITLELDSANYSRKITGSAAEEEYQKQYRLFGADYEKEARKYIKMYSDLRAKVGYNAQGLVQDTLNKIYGKYEYFSDLKDYEYIKAYPKSYVSLTLARGMYKTAVEYEKIKKVYDLLDVSMQNEVIGKDMLRKVNIAKITGVGAFAPAIMLPDSLGKKYSLAAFKGKYVLVDFWYSGCPPCRAQIPQLREIYSTFSPKGFEIIGVSHDMLKNRDKWMQALRADEPTWLNLLDEKNKVCTAYGIESFPSNFLVGPDGKIILYNLDTNDLERWLKDNLM
jgi:peroxiredoxin